MGKKYKSRSEVYRYGTKGLYLVIGKKVDIDNNPHLEHLRADIGNDDVLVQIDESSLVELLKRNEPAREGLLRKAGFKTVPLKP